VMLNLRVSYWDLDDLIRARAMLNND